jgi:tetratricopeptide (TPR) repeat protein
MNETISRATNNEKSLIEAMNSRYSADPTDAKRKSLNADYAAAMRSLISQYPADLEIKALYVDAIMLIHAWDFWTTDGSPKPWTEEVVTLCENILKKNPDHIAALHYHIHLTEASHHPEVALPNADKLKNILPGVAHMVHMASHEYQRNGLYEKGVEVNDLADNNLLHYDSLASNLALVKHSPHYFAVQTYCAMSGGMYKTGMRNAIRCRKSVSPSAESTYDQYLYMMPELTLVRLGKWQEILKENVSPDPKWTYASLLSDFAKGMAFVNTGNINNAKKHLSALREKAKDPVLEKRRIPFNAPLPMANIAEEILNASILFAEKKSEAAITSLNKAIKIEDGLIYTEPNDWPIPARQYLGAFLLKMNKPALAEKVYKEDLMWNPSNGWSLIGLSQSLKAQKKNDKLPEYKSKYMTSFSKADVLPTASVYME